MVYQETGSFHTASRVFEPAELPGDRLGEYFQSVISTTKDQEGLEQQSGEKYTQEGYQLYLDLLYNHPPV